MLFVVIFVGGGILYALIKSPLINYTHLITIISYITGVIIGATSAYVAGHIKE